MPALVKTEYTGRITWLGLNTDRAETLRSVSIHEGFAHFAGFEKESHAGLTRASCSRVSTQYQRGTTIRNTRQFALCCADELAQVAKNMGGVQLNPAWLGTSIVIEGLPDFSHIPPSSRLITLDGAALCVDMNNRPCHLPAKVIDANLPNRGRMFKAAAKGLRGVTAWVEREGMLRVNDVFTLHVPDQPAWRP